MKSGKRKTAGKKLNEDVPKARKVRLRADLFEAVGGEHFRGSIVWRVEGPGRGFVDEKSRADVDDLHTSGLLQHNVGRFDVCKVVSNGAEGFTFYRQKDIAMAKDADCGFMIWDKNSKGTLNNIIDLLNQTKSVELYLNDEKVFKMINDIKTLDDIKTI